MKIIFATGGTGGHIYPALALADMAKKRYKDIDILFIGNDNRMETKIVPEYGYKFKGLHTSGLTGGIFNKLNAVKQMLVAKRKAIKIIKDFKPDIVIGFGGYVSAPVLLAAHSCKVKTLIHEQNSMIGKSNKLLVNKVDGIVVCYEKCLKELPKNKTKFLGNPRSSLAIEKKYDEAYFNTLHVDDSKPIVLIVMGSLGSTSINEMMIEALSKIKDVSIIYVTGKNNYEIMHNELKQENIYVVDYIDQLAILKKIDLIVCRAGATTAAEITALGIPSIMIPSPYVAQNHQYYNASVLVEKKCAYMIEEKDLNANTLCDKIEMVISNKKLMQEMKKNALENSFPNASEDILDFIEEIVGQI